MSDTQGGSGDDFVKLGKVTGLTVTESREDPNNFYLIFTTEARKRLQVEITKGVAQIMWATLTKELFPRAADQMTHRAQTAAISQPKWLSVVHAITLNYLPEKELFALTGVNYIGGMQIAFSRDEGEDLWASLEDRLNMVHTGRHRYGLDDEEEKKPPPE